MNIQLQNMDKTHKSKLTETCLYYADHLELDQLSEMDIDAALEELRPVRMWFHAFEYGDAPGFRSPVKKTKPDLR